ncbi:uncharacterized protein G2W53_022009 [Senna tora]|uniref:Uncharacterized protein n=1 Tax=Senna tora TaxID=362788 RepID=A0A834WHR6_9FABA|nr:uncharacterized protein G2W53_022009 [Senna tora]
MWVRVVFANRSGFHLPIGVVKAWEERGSCLNIFRTINRRRISKTFKNYEAKDLLRNGFDVPIGLGKAWEEHGSCLNIFWMINRGRISETFTNYESKDLLRKNLHKLRGKRVVAQVSKTRRFVLHMRTGVDLMRQLDSSFHARSVDHVLTNSGQQIAVASQKPSRRIRVVKAWEERGSCLNIFRKTNRGWILETFTNYEAKDLAWEERGSCLNLFRTSNCGQTSETFTNYEAKDLLRKNIHELRVKRLVAQVTETRRFALYLRTRVDLMLELDSSRHGRSVDHVITYSERQIAVGSQKPSRITWQKTCCASKRLVAQVSETRPFALYLRTGVDLMFQLESSRHGRSVDHLLTYSGRQIVVGSQKTSRITRYGRSVDHVITYSERKIAVGSQKTSRITRQKTCSASMGGAWIMSSHIPDDKSRSDLRKLHELRGKTLVAQVSETRRFALHIRIGMDLMLKLESSCHGRSLDHVLTYSGQ